MERRNAHAALMTMNEKDNDVVMIVTERFERRLAEENGKLRVEMAQGFGSVRAEIIDRNTELLKWGLLFGATQTAALAAVIALWR